MSHLRVREFGGVGQRAADLPPAVLASISQFALEPVEAGDVIVRGGQICHDQYDRSLERFPKEYLQRFAETLPGKPLLQSHDTRQPNLGRWFDAKVSARTAEIPIFQQPSGKAMAVEPVPGFAPQSKRVTFLDGGVYYPNDADGQAFDRRVSTGVDGPLSIGFRFADLDCDVCKASYFRSGCPHLIGWPVDYEKPDGKLATGTYSGTPEQIQRQVEAVETSTVYLGCQPIAQFSKQLMVRHREVDVEALAMTGLGEIDPVALKEAEGLARRFGHKQKSWAYPGLALKESAKVNREQLIEALGLEKDATDEQILAAVKANREKAEKAAEVESSGDKAAVALKETEGKVTAAETKAADLQKQLDAAKPVLEVGEKALNEIRQEILDHDYALTKRKENLELSGLLDTYVEAKSWDKLTALAAEKRQARSDKYGGKLSGTPETGEDPTEQAPTSRHPRERSSYRV